MGDSIMGDSIFILAGEPSGDALASQIMGAVNATYGQQQWIGVGGPAMQAEGLASWEEMDQLAVIGFGAALLAYPRLSRLMNNLIDRIMVERPRAIFTIDAKGFSLRLAARLKRRMAAAGWQAPIIHTVAPTVWAWGAWRRHRIVKQVDRLLCLFPFEPDYFTPLGLDTRFIGHPEAFNTALMAPASEQSQSGRHIVLLPGSRRSEIAHNLPVMLASLVPLRAQFPDLTVSLVTIDRLQSMVRNMVDAATAGATLDATLDASVVDAVDVVVGQDQLISHVGKADGVLAVSGTVTLQTALLGAPGVTLYKAGALSAWIGRRLVNMDNVILPNAILGQQLYPFLFQEQASADRLSAVMAACLADSQAKSTAIVNAEMLRNALKQNATSFDQLVTSAVFDVFERG